MTKHLPLAAACFVLIPVLLWSVPNHAHGQEEVTPILRGQVRVGDAPLASGVVVLHQVSAEDRGEIDSVQVSPDGTFQIRLPHVPDHTSVPEIFFASVRYEGLLYFGEAITEAVQLDSVYQIQAYDTVSVPQGGAELPVSTRNLFLESAPEGWTATDVFMIQQDGDRTLYSPEEAVVWKYPLPAGIQDFQVGQGDVAPDAVRLQNGLLEVFSPIPPGERYLMVRYRIPGRDFDLPLPGRTDRMEVLVREPAPAGELPPLQLADPVQMDAGAAFRHYVGDALADTEIRAEFAGEPWSLPAEWLGLALLGFLAAAGVVAFRRRGFRPALGEPGGETMSRNQVLVAIAKLDTEYQASDDPDETRQAAYRAARNALLARLKRLS